MSFVAAGLGAAIEHVVSGAPAGNAPLTYDELRPTLEDIRYALTIVKDVLDTANNTARSAVTVATDAGAQIDTIGQNVKDITHHTYETVIPHSLSWLAGYIVSHYIEQLKQRVSDLETAVDVLLRRTGRLEWWRSEFVDPNLERWIGWHQWFDGWPRGVVFTVRDWLQNPDVFGQWAALPIIGPFIGYLRRPEHTHHRLDLLTMLIDSSPERFRHVEAAALAILESEWP